MSIVIRHPDTMAAERAYVFDVIFGDFLGVDFATNPEERRDVCITVTGRTAGLSVVDVFFQTPESEWLRPESIPELPLRQWLLPDDLAGILPPGLQSVPVLFGGADRPDLLTFRSDGSIELRLDIFGSVFFMLTRYEEACSEARDSHGRFPASESLSVRAGIIERPIVDEYVEILWACMQRLKPGLMRRRRRYRIALSHDVDRLFDTNGKSWPTVVKNTVGDIARRKDPTLAVRRLRSKAVSPPGEFRNEPCNTFEFIMDRSERVGVHSAFYFITHHSADGRDGDYTFDTRPVRKLLGAIHERGHELGLHASYHSCERPAQVAVEFRRLREIADEEGIRQDQYGGRQHYLRWKAVRSWQEWEDAGLAYDTTLTYAEAPGFRSGSCFDYPAFNLITRTRLGLRERPLIVMETSLFSDRYLNLSGRNALEIISRLAGICRDLNGQFTMLWHNDNLMTRKQRKLYREALEAIV